MLKILVAIFGIIILACVVFGIRTLYLMCRHAILYPLELTAMRYYRKNVRKQMKENYEELQKLNLYAAKIQAVLNETNNKKSMKYEINYRSLLKLRCRIMELKQIAEQNKELHARYIELPTHYKKFINPFDFSDKV